MIVLEFKLVGAAAQYAAVDEAIRTMQFIRNKCVRKWIDERGVKPYDLNKYCAVLAKEYDFWGQSALYPLGVTQPDKAAG